MDFVKMHGLGNDFVFIEDKTGQDKDYTVLARACVIDIQESVRTGLLSL